MKKILVFMIVFSFSVFLVSPTIWANEDISVDLKGKLTEKISYNFQTERWLSITNLDLELNLDLDYTKQVFLNPILSYTNEPKGELTSELKEGYFDLYLDSMDIRLGKQIVNWGSGYKINPTNKVNPLDLTTTDPTDAQLGVLALKTDYYPGNKLILSGVIVGNFVPSPIPEDIQQKQQTELMSSISQQLLAIVEDPAIMENLMKNLTTTNTEPEIDSLADLEYGLKLTWRDLFGYDLALSYFHGYEDLPALKSNLSSVIERLLNHQPAVIEFDHHKADSFGLDIIGEIEGIGIWSETVFSTNDDQQKQLELVLGGDYTFQNNLYTVVQYYYQDNFDDQESARNYLMLYNQIPWRQIHQLSATALYDLLEQSFLINPEISLSLLNNLTLDLGTLYLSDSEKTNSLLLNSYEQTYIGLTYAF